MRHYEYGRWRNALEILRECVEHSRDVLIDEEQEARAEVMRMCSELSGVGAEPWRWAVREVGLDSVWSGFVTLTDAMSAAWLWDNDGIEGVEVVPLYAGQAVPR
jgi:hypothetical protein